MYLLDTFVRIFFRQRIVFIMNENNRIWTLVNELFKQSNVVTEFGQYSKLVNLLLKQFNLVTPLGNSIPSNVVSLFPEMSNLIF